LDSPYRVLADPCIPNALPWWRKVLCWFGHVRATSHRHVSLDLTYWPTCMIVHSCKWCNKQLYQEFCHVKHVPLQKFGPFDYEPEKLTNEILRMGQLICYDG
jgi:hypothetical protein